MESFKRLSRYRNLFAIKSKTKLRLEIIGTNSIIPKGDNDNDIIKIKPIAYLFSLSLCLKYSQAL
jgi:hypothetical protein